jgi:hypothetical protein
VQRDDARNRSERPDLLALNKIRPFRIHLLCYPPRPFATRLRAHRRRSLILRCNSFREQNIRFTGAATATTSLVPEAGREVSRKSVWPLRRPYFGFEKKMSVRLISKGMSKPPPHKTALKGDYVKSRFSKYVLPANARTSRIEEAIRQSNKPALFYYGNIMDDMRWNPYPAEAGCPTVAGRRRTRAAPVGITPAVSWS